MDWFQQLFTRRRHYEELSESIREHLDEKIADLMDRGMTKGQAKQVAHREFGNVTRIQERSREVWQWPNFESILSDLKYAFRQIRKASGRRTFPHLTRLLPDHASSAARGPSFQRHG